MAHQGLASTVNSANTRYTGHRPLVAAMRAFVASMLGAEVDIPDELL